MTPGYKTTEFWLNSLALVTTLILQSGAFTEESAGGRIVATIGVWLGSLGYTVARTTLKKKAN